MKRLLLTVQVLFVAGVSLAQRSDFHRSSWSSNAVDESHRSSFTASVFIGGLGGPGVGYGGEFEYILGQSGLFSVNIPVSYATSNDHFMVSGEAHSGDRIHDFHTTLIAPGFRYHPAGAFRHFDFAIGVQLAYGSVITEETTFNSYSSQKSNISAGMFLPMADMSIQHVGNDGFIIGFYVAGGPVVGGNYGVDVRGKTIDQQGYFHVGFKMGGNF